MIQKPYCLSSIHAFFFEECKNFGCCEVEVSTESSNISALQFYKKYGFNEKGIFLEKDL